MHHRVMKQIFKSTVVHFLIALCILLTPGCSSAPPKEVVMEAAVWTIGGSAQQLYVNGTIKISNFKINNQYTRVIGGETYYVYDVEFSIEEGGQLAVLPERSVAIVRRGDAWYFTQ